MKDNWAQRHCLQLREPRSWELLESEWVFWGPTALLLHLSAIRQRWRQGISEKDLCPDLAVLISSYLLSLFRAGALEITLHLWMKTDSNDSLADPSQRPQKPGEGARRKSVSSRNVNNWSCPLRSATSSLISAQQGYARSEATYR